MDFAQRKTYELTVNAHRGYNVEYPENTLLAFSKAIELGADYIELDVRRSSDGHLYIFHDQNLKRRGGIDRDIRGMTLEELKQVDLGQGQTIPTLEEVFHLCKGKIGTHIEIKEEGLSKQVAEVVSQFSMEDEVIFSSFKHIELVRIKRFLPNVPTATIEPAGDYRDRPLAEFYEMIIHNAKAAGVQGIHLNIFLTEEPIAQLAHEAGLWLNTYNVDSFILWEACIDMGVDGVFTNDAKGMIEFLKKRSKV